jgi:hypothetical protein
MSKADDTIARSARVMTAYPPNRPGWRKGPDGKAAWSGPTSPIPVDNGPSKRVGVEYAAGIRWGTFVGFLHDDRGLLAEVTFEADAHGPGCDDTVRVARIVGLDGEQINAVADTAPVLAARAEELEQGINRAAADLDQLVGRSDVSEALRALLGRGCRP